MKQSNRSGARFLLWVSICALAALFVPESARSVELLAGGLVLLGGAIGFGLPARALPKRKRPALWAVPAGVIFALCAALRCAERWSILPISASLAGWLGLDTLFFCRAVGTVLGLLSLWLWIRLADLADALLRWLEARVGGSFFVGLIALFCVGMQIWAMQTSAEQLFLPVLEPYVLLSLLMVLGVNALLAALLGRWGRAAAATAILFTIWGVANRYVILFHGSPLFLSELTNTKTALNVVGGYSLVPDGVVRRVLMALPPQLALAASALRMEKNKHPRPRWHQLLWRLTVFSSCVITMAYWLFSVGTLVSWSANDAILQYGMLPSIADDARRHTAPFRQPVRMDETIEPVSLKTTWGVKTRPDIILILNETFCDLDYYLDLKESTDGAYLAPFYDIPGAVYGWAVAPMVGGGTNNSEYELLTGNSTFLLNAAAPFNYIHFNETTPSFVAYLNQLGYTSLAMHSGNRANYSRASAYPALGFDRIRLGSEEYEDLGQYGSRWQLDSKLYDTLLADYRAMGDAPRFCYVLTYQNHGGYEQNPSNLDRVQVQKNYGEFTDDVDEYLTSISMSASAFRALTEQLSRSSRPVIVCMVGDHAPVFIRSLPNERGWSTLERELATRTVPYVIWTNYDAGISECAEYTSMFGIMPQVLQAARLPRTPYVKTILSLQDRIPVFSANGLCMDTHGRVTSYDPTDEDDFPVLRYLTMEYRSLSLGAGYQEEWYFP